MSDKNTGGSAFPARNFIVPKDLEDKHVRALMETQGMTLRDYFAIRAPECPASYISTQQGIDHQKNPHNDSYKPKLRSTLEIIACWNYEYADAMLEAREL